MRILVIGAHPQYAGMFLSGTIHNHVQRGDEVYVVALSDAEGLTNLVPMDKVAEANRNEMLTAAEILGIKEVRFLGLPDTYLKNNDETRLLLNNIIREIKPDVMISHWPKDTLSDLRETGMAAIDASFNALLVTGKWCEKFPSHWTSKAYAFEHPGLSVDFRPSLFVDISKSIEVKKKAIECFKIQIKANYGNDLDRWTNWILSPNRYWGIESGCTFAEAFAQIKIHEVHNKSVEYLIP
jgi:N-acetylglucosamine malate deacetylase 1